MNEILSNEEIDTLLDMFRSEGGALDDDGAVGAKSDMPIVAADNRVVSPIDLLKPNRLGREQLRGIERHFESAGKFLSATISDKLRTDIRCDCVAVEQQRFGAWLDAVPGPVAFYVLGMKPFQYPCLLTASTSLLYGAVDRILGGSGRIARVPDDFTAAEYTVAEALIGPCLDRICESLAEVVELQWSIENSFCNPSLAQILPSQDVVMTVYFQVAGEFLIGDLRLTIPFAAIEPLIEGFTRDRSVTVESGAMKDTVAKTLRGVPIRITGELGETRIRLRQMLALQPGDVIPLDKRIGQLAIVPVQGKPKFRAHIGRIGNRMGLQVADIIGN
ncbi:MAG: FliM/FliN family flagellar motor switch protein [Planctomycetes bacterium]|nr:FliM/FliN family flagellar motor switch protein [Planctomycetota bacterium]